ncbi:MAG: hypothetical protein LBJ11_04025 [Oscillospiraceae bacterium]|jgi:tetratricopeptide (TPR) repeat protein|nr:hypothetical protein [Oscillospiraceae bacterium]
MKKLLSIALTSALLLSFASCAKAYTPKPNPPLVLGEKYLLDLDYEQALLQFDEAIKIDPKNPRGYLGKADALLHLDRQAEAAAALGNGAKIVPKEQREPLRTAQVEAEKSPVDGYIGLSSAYEKLGWVDIALALLRRVCEELPEESRLFKALERLMDILDTELTAVSGEATEAFTGEPEEMPISAQEQREVEAFIQGHTANINLHDLFSRYAMNVDKLKSEWINANLAYVSVASPGFDASATRKSFEDQWTGTGLISNSNIKMRVDITSVAKFSRKGLRQFISAYHAQGYEEFWQEYKNKSPYSVADSVYEFYERLVRVMYDCRLPIDSADVVYKAVYSITTTYDGNTTTNKFTEYIVHMDGKLQRVMTVDTVSFGGIS